MKTKKLNRGLAIGAALLVGLGGYVTFDYFNFKSNKDDIKAAVENYLNESAKASISQDGNCREAIEKVISDKWGYNEFYSKSYVMSYTTADDITSSLNMLSDHEMEEGHLTDCTVTIANLKVSKAGPNLAQAEATVVMNIKGVGPAHILTPHGITNTVFDTDNYNRGNGFTASSTFKDLEYSGKIEFDDDATFFLEYDDGDWKIVGANAYIKDFVIEDSDGKEIDLDKASKGETSKSGDDDNDSKTDSKADAGKFKIKLPDGTMTDIPEDASIADLEQLPEGAEIIRVGSEPSAANTSDDSSDEKSGGEG